MTQEPATHDAFDLLASILEESTPLLGDSHYMRGQRDAFKTFVSNPYFEARDIEGLKRYLLIFSLGTDEEEDANFPRAYTLGLNSALQQLLGMLTYVDPTIAMAPEEFNQQLGK